MNTITIELCAEDRARLDAILAALKDIKPNCHSCTETALRMMQANTAPAQAEEHPVGEVSPHGTPEPAEERFTDAAAEPAAPEYTLADVRAVVQRLIGPGSNKREQAQAIVNDYAVKISAIPAEKYPEVMDRLIALEKGAANG